MSSRERLLEVAQASVAHGVHWQRPLAVDASHFPASLQEQRASFVTLHHEGELRGCVGSMEAVRTLVVDVAENAFAAATRDPRFDPVSPAELEGLSVQISILSEPEPLGVRSEQELLELLRPGVDGLILQRGLQRATFLPQVWKQLPAPSEFVRQLKRKAADLRVARYGVETIDDPTA
jgi:AmmeMemoRadiSam system protein A